MIAQHSGILAMALVFVVSSCCCCGNLFDVAQLQGLSGGDMEQILEEQLPGVAELLEPTLTAEEADALEEAIQNAEQAEAAADAVQATTQAQLEAIESGELPPDEAPSEMPVLPDELEQDLEDYLNDQQIDIGCDDADFPLPDDAANCVSTPAFTSFSTGLDQDEVNALYNNYFTSRGWQQFPMLMEGNDDILNAWQSADGTAFMVLTFMPEQGVDRPNMVSLAKMGNP